MAQNFPFPFPTGGGQPPPHASFTRPSQGAAPQQQQPAMMPGAYGQATQPSAFVQNGQPPAVDMTALEGISPEQLAAIARLFQTGALPMAFAPQSAPTQNVPTVPPTLASSNPQAQEHAKMMDRMDTKGAQEGSGTQTQRVSTKAPPSGPRSMVPRNASGPTTIPQESRPKSVNYGDLQKNSMASQEFILLLYKSGYGFDDIAKEVKNTQALRRMFNRLGLSTAATPHTQIASSTSGAEQPHVNGLASKAPASSTSASARPPAAPAKAPAPANRSEYLAKLAAAKNKKPEPKPATVSKVPEVPTKAPVAPSRQPSAMSMTKTELARQRLDALRAEQAAKQNALRQQSMATKLSAPVVSDDVQPQQTKANLPAIKSQALSTEAPSGILSPTHPSTLGGLPGLFMGSAPSPQPPSQTPNQNENHVTAPSTPPASTSVSRKRPVATDFDESSFGSAYSASKRPFGQSPHYRADERMVIEVSDDEDELEQNTSHGSATQFASRYNFQTGQSTPGQSPALTPGNVDYEKKMAEIEEFKRIIAQREALRLSKGAKDNVDASSSSSGRNTPNVVSEMSTTSTPQATVVAPTTRNAATVALERQRQKQLLQQRMEELKRGMKAQAKTATPEHMMSGALPPEAPTPSTETQSAVRSNGIIKEPTAGENIASSTEDGEIDDSEADVQPKAAIPGGTDDIIPDAIDTTGDESESDSDGMDIESSSEDNSDEEESDGDDDDESSDSDGDEMDVSNSDSESDGSQLDEATQDNHQENPQLAAESPHDPGNTSSDSSHSMSPSNDSVDSGAQHVHDDSFIQSLVAEQSQHQSNSESDQFVPELQKVQEAQATDSDRVRSTQLTTTNLIQEQDSKPRNRFVPYKSALSVFKDYRFHPKYLDEVPGGFRSLTYNHNIDPMETLCTYEAAGGICNDKRCTSLHFNSIALDDNNLLKILGTEKIPARTAEEQERWREGLSEVIKQLRSSDMGKDTAAIASRIAEYRREFIGDPTKTLNLD